MNIFEFKNKLNHAAFTLAEVLITLGIIGIVAAMTIPTLMNDVQDKQYKVALKKQYSALSQVYLSIANDNGGSFSSAFTSCGAADTNAGNTCFKDVIKAKLQYAKECDGGSALGTCLSTQANTKTLDGNAANNWGLSNTLAGLIFNDGTSLGIHFAGTGVNSGWLIIDVNGLKQPNTWGRDLFLIYYDARHIFPAAPSTELNVDDCISTGLGHSCPGKYLMGN